VPAGDIDAANFRSEKFGTFSLYKQLSSKLSGLPECATYDVLERYASLVGGRVAMSAFGTKQTFRPPREMSDSGSKADIANSRRHVRL
jgi:hypothetical protein